jgi:uncharacterized protein (DUF3820 family)
VDNNQTPEQPPHNPIPDPRVLMEIVEMRMPFGRYKGQRLADLPEPYLVWFSQQGFPKGKLGQLMETVYVIKLNGLNHILAELKCIAQDR